MRCQGSDVGGTPRLLLFHAYVVAKMRRTFEPPKRKFLAMPLPACTISEKKLLTLSHTFVFVLSLANLRGTCCMHSILRTRHFVAVSVV